LKKAQTTEEERTELYKLLDGVPDDAWVSVPKGKRGATRMVGDVGLLRRLLEDADALPEVRIPTALVGLLAFAAECWSSAAEDKEAKGDPCARLATEAATQFRALLTWIRLLQEDT